MVIIFSHIAVPDHEPQTSKIFYGEIMYLYLIRIDCKWKHHHQPQYHHQQQQQQQFR